MTGVAERGVASMARARSLQSRLSGALALLLSGALAVGLLVWYYRAVLSHRHSASAARHAASPAGSADNSLPPLGPIRDPRSLAVTSDPAAGSSAAAMPTPLSESAASVAALSAADLPLPPATSTPGAAASINPQTPLDRRLAGPAFAGSTAQTRGEGTSADHPTESADHTGALAGLLTPTTFSPARASELPSQRLLLAKGAFIDCTLEAAIDSSLPGMTTCITATDTFSVDGKVVLLERGSKLIGETRGQVQQGSARLFVLWTEARTPTGVIVPLASPGTDALGRSGLDGEVDRHFWQRFGAAILISMVDAAAEASQRSGGTVIYDTSSSQGVATEALKGTVGIAPTITKNQGDRIQILVARDLDFRQVYQLRDSETLHQR
ncbi:MAG TPA: type IV secretion system protein VirB10 [Steroidobacteraceae bacterium]|jgi:type IV secretion system protein VirB10|nr:type IV secretion system protein VirB10 [Steroidobacteraceae bacterium]